MVLPISAGSSILFLPHRGVVYYIYPLIGLELLLMTYAFCYHFQLDDPLIRKKKLPIPFFLGQSLCLGADSAFLLSSRPALAPDLELAVLGLRLGFFLESLPFRDFRPLPLAWSRLPLAKYFQSSRIATCASPKSWTFWRWLETLHEIEEPVLFRHIHNVQG